MKYLFLLTLIFSYVNAKIIAEIPEASGICYLKDSQELVVVNDEGYIYKLTTKGKILKEKHLGDYDFEGVTTYKGDLLLAVEDKNAVFIVDVNSFEIIKKVKIKKHKDVQKSKNNGIEGIAVVDGKVYLAHQKSGFFKIAKLTKKKTKIKKVYKHKYSDLSGLTFHDGFLYILSDKNDLLIKYDVKTKKTLTTTELPKSDQEGVCFDENGNIYIADDKGYIHTYNAKELGL